MNEAEFWVFPQDLPTDIRPVIEALWNNFDQCSTLPANWRGPAGLLATLERHPGWPAELTSPDGRRLVRRAVTWLQLSGQVRAIWITTRRRHRRRVLLLAQHEVIVPRQGDAPIAGPPAPADEPRRESAPDSAHELVRNILAKAKAR